MKFTSKHLMAFVAAFSICMLIGFLVKRFLHEDIYSSLIFGAFVAGSMPFFQKQTPKK
jgi:hypothetical protein